MPLAAEPSVLSSPVCSAVIAKNGHVWRISRNQAATFLCSEDLLAERVGKELSGYRRQQVLNSETSCIYARSPSKLATTAGSEFSSLTENPVFGEKRRLWRESRKSRWGRGELEIPDTYPVKLLSHSWRCANCRSLVCSFRNSEVLTGKPSYVLTRRMLYPWHLLYSGRRDGSGRRDVGSHFREALLEIRKGSTGDDARGLCFQLLRGVQQEWQFISPCGLVSSSGYSRQQP